MQCLVRQVPVDSPEMSKPKQAWILTKGWSLGGGKTRDPRASEIAAALECMHAGMDNPFVILEPPPADGFIPSYCQVLADDVGKEVDAWADK
jgi:hypothetical protein